MENRKTFIDYYVAQAKKGTRVILEDIVSPNMKILGSQKWGFLHRILIGQWFLMYVNPLESILLMA